MNFDFSSSPNLQSHKASQILFRLTKLTTMVHIEQKGNIDIKERQKVGLKVLGKCVDESALGEAPQTIRPVLKTKSQDEKMSKTGLPSPRVVRGSNIPSHCSQALDQEDEEIASEILSRLMKATAMVRTEHVGNTEERQEVGLKVHGKCLEESDLSNGSTDYVEAFPISRPALKNLTHVKNISESDVSFGSVGHRSTYSSQVAVDPSFLKEDTDNIEVFVVKSLVLSDKDKRDFLGTKGATINYVRQMTGSSIELDCKNSVLTLMGDETSVDEAISLSEKILEKELKEKTKTIKIKESACMNFKRKKEEVEIKLKVVIKLN